ncbi:MAG: dehydrogenase E1 component subunit alpha/beta [Candidatus Eisenbacteria bacterium]|nr:dehydrogenase E1 component subunit alpha/beta [Candidatus Eisenbacteria bacterium]MCC7143327.1 dehydrogenase E1 component subunit alpha/beta [Candidatus Eisenbacteria bacterium]
MVKKSPARKGATLPRPSIAPAERERLDRDLYRKLTLVRMFDEKVAVLHRQNKVIGGVYSGIGQEAIVVGATQPLTQGDVIFPLHRDMGIFLMRGIDPAILMAQILGRATGLSGGRDSFLHTGEPKLGVFGATSMLGATLPVATGCAMAFKTRGEKRVAIALFGEGSTSRGDFHEALNFAGIHQLPVVYICENNQLAFSTPTRLQMPVETVAERADAYGIHRSRTHGNDLNRVIDEVEKAVERARNGEGATLIECVTYRIRGHSEHDPAKYRSEDDVVEWASRDPLELWELYLEKRGYKLDQMREEIRTEIAAEIERAVEFAESSPFPEPSAARTAVFYGPYEQGTGDILDPDYGATPGPDGTVPHGPFIEVHEEGVAGRAAVEGDWRAVAEPFEEQEVTYLEAIRQTLIYEMERDGRVFCLGEDIGTMGGAFGVTKGLIEQFGEERVIDTPISESLIVGGAVGAAIVGMRPVAEMQFADFITCGFDQLANSAATMCYRHGGKVGVPMVVRCPSGARIRGGLFHSQNVENFFLTVPGVKIVAPATAEDASGLLRAAIHDPNPVIFLEYKYLYRRVKAKLRRVADPVPIGIGAFRRLGADLSLVTYGPTVHLCLDAAVQLEQAGIQAEVLDLRTVKPLDMESILHTVRKTHRLLIVHEDRTFCGLGAEISARISEQCFDWLDAPVRRVCTADTHYAYAPVLEDSILPSVESIVAAAKEVVGY